MVALVPTPDSTARWLADHAGADVDAMTGTQFESCLAVVFTRLGYAVELTETYDFGADLIVSKDGIRSAVQAKRQEKRMGEHAVQQAVAGRAYYRCELASVVTNAEIQPRARTLADIAGVSIMDRVHLTRMLQMAEMLDSPRLLPAPQCARCDIPLVARSGRYGPFWGCENYPHGCRVKAQHRYSLLLVRITPAAPGLRVLSRSPDQTRRRPWSPWRAAGSAK
jgi:Restriction endonuclease